jgi:hypothetical protein
MSQGRLYHLIWLQLSLIAVAVQGITPDAQDMASLKALWLLCLPLADSGVPSDDDGTPDEVCEPVGAQINRIARQPVGCDEQVRPVSVSIESRPNSVAAAGSMIGKPARTNSGDGLVFDLCRLNC